MSDREVKLIISADGGVAIAATKEVADSFKKLGSQSVADINKQKQDVTAAYETIKKSGTVSAAEIAQAEAAKNRAVKMKEPLFFRIGPSIASREAIRPIPPET